jgi:hypothetical protein
VRSLIPAVVLLLGAPGVAGAAVTPGDYGGGGFAKGGLPTWMWARVAADGSARIGGRIQRSCALGHFDARVRLAPDGAFSFTRTRKTHEQGHVVRARVTVSGRFDGTIATGTIRARLSDRLPSGRVQRCGTPRPEPWKAHLRPAAGAQGAPQPGGAYLGLTSQEGKRPSPFVLRVTLKGTRVGVAIFDYVRVCRKGRFALANVTPGGPIRADGTFALRERFTVRFRGRVRERFRIDIDGRFTAGGVTGSLRVGTVARRGGRVIDRCDTGPLTFTAAL